MKKYILCAVCLLLSVLMLLSMTGCNNLNEATDKIGTQQPSTDATQRTKLQARPPDHKGMIGEWTGTCDYSALYEAQFGRKFTDIKINAIENVKYTFDNEGYCTIESDKKSLYDSVMISIQTYCDENEISIDDFYATIGNTAESFRNNFLGGGEVISKREIYNFSGDTFTWNGITYTCQYSETSITYSLAGGRNVVNLTKVGATGETTASAQ